MPLGNVPGDLAAHYGCKPDQLLEENELLWEVLIEILKTIGIEAASGECPELKSFAVNKLQVLKSYLRVRRFVQ